MPNPNTNFVEAIKGSSSRSTIELLTRATERNDEETPRRRLQMPLAAAHQDGWSGEGEGGKFLEDMAPRLTAV
jgi:hypothetical protein